MIESQPKETHSKTIIRRLEKDIFPYIGDRPIAEVSAQDVLQVLRRVEERGAFETAHREKGICSQVFCYAVATGRIEHDPTSGLRGALSSVKTKHMAAITEPMRVGKLMRMIDGYQGTLVVQCALKLAPLVFVRPGELRQALWKDINWEKKQWELISSKTNKGLIVPLSTQAFSILRELQPLTGHGEYIFPGVRPRQRPMSENAILAALRGMGIPKEEMTGHGFRAMARTLLDEELGVNIAWIELQLAHNVKDPLGRSYNRTEFLPQRQEMMQKWADYLDELKAGS
ncbi:site-specific integrase [Acaryochloris sp. 'Moss Beach']|uniref:tyrosine-type recombinase/integrase n=1 Tax=Acaryochloris sp. 'Moss Beach' TaxID=2740837 RepID=UPI001F29C88B|nr:site-specific integrase [Acaryochloris sp. 'Moss Beach']